MIIHMSRTAAAEDQARIYDKITAAGFQYEVIHGATGINVIGILGDLSRVPESYFRELAGVDKVVRISKAYKLVSREYSAKSKVIDLGGGVSVGAKELAFMAGPCSLESVEQMMTIGAYVSSMGIKIIRGGAYKPRTSPYSFQGMGLEGLKLLAEVRKKFGLKIVTEATGLHHHIDEAGNKEQRNVLENVIDYADIIQIGARNMKSYGFLQELGILTKDCKKPILLKRGDSSTLKDFLLAAEYIVANGNPNVILCLRGIRTFEEEKFQRYTPDIGAITVLKRESNLPVIFDPSHAVGYRASVPGAALAAVAAGADGLLIETHNDPPNAMCDGEQSVTEEQLRDIKRKADVIWNLFW
ncbi:MAG: 3-deoxy-7-phosphoheptulonate synthase [Chitinispirillales bacterium]|jgi:3-deoxy-7-phosphoheptulonate synthase|nr:3-deoxy-7-phosphoheptulonate synthase [Chitinispirillales bacterium]